MNPQKRGILALELERTKTVVHMVDSQTMRARKALGTNTNPLLAVRKGRKHDDPFGPG